MGFAGMNTVRYTHGSAPMQHTTRSQQRSSNGRKAKGGGVLSQSRTTMEVALSWIQMQVEAVDVRLILLDNTLIGSPATWRSSISPGVNLLADISSLYWDASLCTDV